MYSLSDQSFRHQIRCIIHRLFLISRNEPDSHISSTDSWKLKLSPESNLLSSAKSEANPHKIPQQIQPSRVERPFSLADWAVLILLSSRASSDSCLCSFDHWGKRREYSIPQIVQSSTDMMCNFPQSVCIISSHDCIFTHMDVNYTWKPS